MADIKFIEGIRIFKPREGAPEFIIANGIVSVSDLIAFADKEGVHSFRFDVLESRSGKYYAQLNTWQPKPAEAEEKKEQPKNQDVPF